MRASLQVLIVVAAAVALLGCQEQVTAGPTKAEFAAERDRLARQAARSAVERTQSSAAGAGDWTSAEARASLASAAGSYQSAATIGRDPFRSILFEMRRAEEAAPRAPLEQFDLGQIAVLAVIWDAVKPRALIMDPGGRSFVIEEGSRVGKNSGRVVDIGDNVVLVRETYVNYAGERITKDIAMRIRSSQGG